MKNNLTEKIGNFLERLKGYLDSTLNHTINKDILSTNNLLEGFYKITFPRKIKKNFRIISWSNEQEFHLTTYVG